MVRNFQETLSRSNDKSEIVIEKIGKRKLSWRRCGGSWPGLAPPRPTRASRFGVGPAHTGQEGLAVLESARSRVSLRGVLEQCLATVQQFAVTTVGKE